MVFISDQQPTLTVFSIKHKFGQTNVCLALPATSPRHSGGKKPDLEYFIFTSWILQSGSQAGAEEGGKAQQGDVSFSFHE